MNPRAAGAAAMRRNRPRPVIQGYQGRGPIRPPLPPPGGKHGGQVKGYQGGGVPVGAERREYVKGFLGKTRANAPIGREWARDRANKASHIQQAQRNLAPPRPRGWQLGGEVGAAPEEVAMASEIFARATPEQQDQITGGGAPAMDEEAAIGEALAMAMGGGGGGGPPMNGAPPMGGLI